MSAPDNITTAADQIPDDREWSEVLWDSLRDIPEAEAPEAEADASEQEAPQPDAPQPEAPAAPEQPAGEAPAEAPAEQ